MSLIPTRQEYLRRYLVPFWLRPESALWYAHEAHLARSYLGSTMPQPSLEFACFDGTPTFILLGGEFGLQFDVYSEVNWSRDIVHWKSLQDDYYNVAKQTAGPLDVLGQPSEQFEIGLTAKKAHLEKASRLGIYRRLVEHDPNLPMTMFAEGTFACVWAPNVYWVTDIAAVLAEVRRVMQPEGRFVTVLPDTKVLEFLLYGKLTDADTVWVQDLDRGRYANFARNARTLTQWSALFDAAGLRIHRHDELIPELVLRVHDVGFRPMFPVLMNIYETLRARCPEQWVSIKQHWVETAFHFLAPLCDVEWMARKQMKHVWHIFDLRRNK